MKTLIRVAMAFALSTAFNLGSAARLEADAPSATPAVPIIEFVSGSTTLRGMSLKSNPERACVVILTVDGKLTEMPRLDVQETRKTEETFQPSADAILRGLESKDEWTRDHCQRLVAVLAKSDPELLRQSLRSDEPETVWRALEILGRNPQRVLLPSIRTCLRHAHERVRARAVKAYAAHEARDWIVHSSNALKDSSLWVRHEAVVTLGRTKDLTAVEALVGAVQEPGNETLASAMIGSLQRMTGERLPKPRHWQAWWTYRTKGGEGL